MCYAFWLPQFFGSWIQGRRLQIPLPGLSEALSGTRVCTQTPAGKAGVAGKDVVGYGPCLVGVAESACCFVFCLGGIKDKSQEDLCIYSTDGLFFFSSIIIYMIWKNERVWGVSRLSLCSVICSSKFAGIWLIHDSFFALLRIFVGSNPLPPKKSPPPQTTSEKHDKHVVFFVRFSPALPFGTVSRWIPVGPGTGMTSNPVVPLPMFRTTTKSVVSVAWWSRISSLMQMWLGHFDWNPSWTSKGTTPPSHNFWPQKHAGIICQSLDSGELTCWKMGPKWRCIYFLLNNGDIPASHVSLPEGISEDDGGWTSLTKGRIFFWGGGGKP